jgi:hypothetical protein
MPTDGDEYEVGYRKPPRAGQFTKGRSGNPKGRGKGRQNFATVIQDELRARVDITENGRRRSISKREAVAKQLVNGAAAGDPKAIPVLLSETRPHENSLAHGYDEREQVTLEDQMVMESILRRILQTQQSEPKPGEARAESPAKPTDKIPVHKIQT